MLPQRESHRGWYKAGLGWRTSGSPLLHSGLIARDGLRRVDASTVAIHALEIRVAQRSKGRYPPGGVEGKELLENKEGQPHPVNKKSRYGCRKHHKSASAGDLSTNKRVRPCSSMSGTRFSIGLGGRGVKALCGKATSWGQSSAEGTPTTLRGRIHLSAQLEPTSTHLTEATTSLMASLSVDAPTEGTRRGKALVSFQAFHNGNA